MTEISTGVAIAAARRPVPVEEFPVRRREMPGAPIQWHGYTIRADGFDEESFAAAIERAMSEGVTITPGPAPRSWFVRNPTNLSEYVVTPGCCTCRAGDEVGRGCKHRSIVALVEAIIETANRPKRPP